MPMQEVAKQKKQRPQRYDRSWLVNYRNIAGFGIEAMARVIGISLSMLYKIEAGYCMPNVVIGIRIANLLGFDVSEWERDFSERKSIGIEEATEQ